MSLGSDHPEVFTEALHRSLARQIVEPRMARGWMYAGKSQEELEENVVYALDQLSCLDKDNPHGVRLVYDFLIDQADSHDVLERFHEHFR